MGTQETAAWIFGIILVFIGILGFFNDPIFGYFQVNGLHNIVHLATGLIFIWGAWIGRAKRVNQTFGIIYILLAIIGFLVALRFLEMGAGADPDNFLHAFLGVLAVLVGSMADDNGYKERVNMAK